MKLKLRTGILVVLGIMLILSVPLVANSEEEPVKFPNHDVKLAVKQQIGKAVGEVYPSELKKLTRLRVYYSNVESLSWIKHCTDLNSLDLRDNNIHDISSLADLTKLQYIQLDDNNISDLSPLSGLHKLKKITLGRNNITDIQPLVDNFKVKKNGEEIGLGKGDRVVLRHNNLDLSEGSEDLQDIQTLIDRGVEVEYYPQKEGESS